MHQRDLQSKLLVLTMSIGKVTNSALSASLEATIALAAANFDFSLVKIQAPKEYLELGTSLSNMRSIEAEEGQIHVTARKLGALFADVVPRTPTLYQAYGVRTSEIAKSPHLNEKEPKCNSMFSDHLGIDATSIWAAATSGETAIAVHLLACMLAQMWSHAEAVSILVEFIDERKRIIRNQDQESGLGVLALQGSRISLSRTQVAAWDASARAWLQIADEVKKLQQTQLMLILNNVGTSVNPKPFLYQSVLQAWISSLVTMENLLNGTNQSVEDGGSLLGLASWHLYPDLLVLGETTQKVAQKDKLFPSGTLVTIGLRNGDMEKRGVYWSLPLAHLCFYGNPVSITRCVNQETSRVTVEQLLLVSLGALIGPWIRKISELEIAINFMSHLKQCSFPKDCTKFRTSWLWHLGEQADKYMQTKKERQTELWQLINVGMRRYTSFLPQSPREFFGLKHPNKLLRTMEPEQRIAFLRYICRKRYSEHTGRMVIQYLFQLPFGPKQYEYALVASSAPSKKVPKRQSDGSVKFPPDCLTRWIQSSGSSIRGSHVAERQQQIESLGEKVILVPENTFLPSLQLRSGMIWTNAPQDIFKVFEEQKSATTGFEMLFGDEKLGAVFATIDDDLSTELTDGFTLEELTDAFAQRFVSQELLMKYLNSLAEDREMQDMFQGLKTLSLLAFIYDNLNGARIPLQIANRRIIDWQWCQEFCLLDDNGTAVQPITACSKEAVFACIAMCESGAIDVAPDSLSAVMAISSRNSLYVAASLLQDPWNPRLPFPVRRIVGNVGRPGIVMMIAPVQPRVCKLDEGTWHLISHTQFDGGHDDMFQQLTLHLSISEWQQAVDADSIGYRDTEICFVNGFVGVYERGTWVADLNILGMFEREEWRPLPQTGCSCGGDRSAKISPFPWPLLCIDRWEELIDPPLTTSIIRARNNWQARLALAVLSVQLGHKTYIISPDHCWRCCVSSYQVLPENPFQCFQNGNEAEDEWSSEVASEEIVELKPKALFDKGDVYIW